MPTSNVDVYWLIMHGIADFLNGSVEGIDPSEALLSIPGIRETEISFILDTLMEAVDLDPGVFSKAIEINSNVRGFVTPETKIGEFISMLTGASSILSQVPTSPTGEDHASTASPKPHVSNRPEVNLDGYRWSRVPESNPKERA